MRLPLTALLLGAAVAAGCSTSSGRPLPVPGGPDGTVIVADDGRAGPHERRGAHGARSVRVPPGHYPPPGQCRIWHPGRPPGHQPPPARCDQLRGRVPYGAFILYNGREWDTRYDWRAHERRERGSVPEVILHLVSSLVR
jgi:hypothetical protein